MRLQQGAEGAEGLFLDIASRDEARIVVGEDGFSSFPRTILDTPLLLGGKITPYISLRDNRICQENGNTVYRLSSNNKE